jgi:AcrR family transcriptional regulator
VIEQTIQRTARRRLRPEQRREEILDGAARIVLGQGVEAMTMEGLAREAGVNKALPYHYFISRNGVLCALAEREFSTLLAVCKEAIDEAVGLEAKLAALVECWMDMPEQRRAIVLLELFRINSNELHETLRSKETAAAVFVAGFLSAERNLALADSLMLASSLLGLAKGLLWSRKVTGWDRRQLLEMWGKMAMSVADAVQA